MTERLYAQKDIIKIKMYKRNQETMLCYRD